MVSLPRVFLAGPAVGAVTALATALAVAAARGELGTVVAYLPPIALLGAAWALPASAAALAVDRVWRATESRRRIGAAAAAAAAAAFLPILLNYYPQDADLARLLLITVLPAAIAAGAVVVGWPWLQEADTADDEDRR